MMGKEEEIIDLSDDRALAFLKADPGDAIAGREEFEILMKQAIFGFRVKREIMLNKRMDIDQRLRAVKLAIATPEDRERYIRATAPSILPQLQDRPEKK